MPPPSPLPSLSSSFQVHPEGKFVVDLDKSIEMKDVQSNCRVALRNDSYRLHKILPNKVRRNSSLDNSSPLSLLPPSLPSQVDPLVSLMMVEKVPDSTYDMIGGLDKQIKEIKEVIELPVKHPELFESLGIAQPKVGGANMAVLSVIRIMEDCVSSVFILLQFSLLLLSLPSIPPPLPPSLPPQGVLLYGPPGTGKTLLARAVAHHTECCFIRVSGSELVQKYIGEGSRMVRGCGLKWVWFSGD